MGDKKPMTSTRPYLIRAFYDWIVDNGCTPHIVVNTSITGVEVPVEYIENEQIVLNIATSAVQGLALGDKAIEFRARFGGQVRRIWAPVTSVLAIYARENGRGMVFAEEEESEEPPTPPASSDSDEKSDNKKSNGRSHLRVVK